MRILSLCVFVISANLQALALLVQQNHPCNNQRDTLLAEDPDGSSNAFLRCRGVGIGTIGFWERKICPNNMQFDFMGQQCRTDNKKYRHRSGSEKRLNIAILNNSCAKGEQCIGGTVCDLESMKCLCPFGTMAQLETLSCVRDNYNNALYRQLPPDIVLLPPTVETATPAFFRPPPLMGNGNQQSSFILPPRPSIFPSPTPSPLPSLAAPGSSCREGQVCGGGSECNYPLGVCLCPGDLEDHGGHCTSPPPPRHAIAKVGLGAICNRLAECDDGSSCVDGKCRCLPPLRESNGKCILQMLPAKEVGPGEPCENGEICVRGSVCYDQVPVCVCPSETTLVEDRCVRSTSNVLQPMPISPVDQPAPSPYSYSQLPATPPTVRPPYAAKPNYVKLQLGGSKQAGVGVPCSLNTDCMIGAYCNGNTDPSSCQCLSTHVSINGRCEKVIYPGQTGCQHDAQCSSAFAGSSCIDRECICPEGSRAIEQTCVSARAYPGELCRTATQCSGSSICINEICVCPPPLVHMQRQCVNKSDVITQHGNPILCNHAEDCPADLLCLEGQCKCPSGMYQKGISCVDARKRRRRRAVEQAEEMICWPDQQICANGKGICLAGVCHCTSGYVQINGKCNLEKRPSGAFCEGDRQCEDGAECKEGLCSCVTQECYKKIVKPTWIETTTRSVGESCIQGEQCRNGSSCILGRCQCPNGFHVKDGECQQTHSGFTPINSQCTENDRCTGGSVCSSNICSCVDGSLETNGNCKQIPGGRCVHGETCAGDSQCEMGTCQCMAGFRLVSGKCVSATANPGRSCQEGQTCLHGSSCRFGVCMCSAGFRVSNERCEKRTHFTIDAQQAKMPPKIGNAKRNTSARPGHLCLDGELCIGGSRCSLDGFCVCPDDQVIIADQCIRSEAQASMAIEAVSKAAPGQFCLENTTCTGQSICLANTCTCPQGTSLEHGECTMNMSRRIHSEPKKGNEFLPGTMCEFTSECPYRTECLRAVCRCRPGETIVDNLCRAAVYAVSPGGKCDPKLGLDCIGESHCLWGICSCTRGLLSTGIECAAEVHRISEPGETCQEGQKCAGGSFCQAGICKCLNTEQIRNKKCVHGGSTLRVPTTSKLPNGPHDRLLSQLPGMLGEHGVNQILTANSMSINLVDPHTMSNLVNTKNPIPCVDGQVEDGRCVRPEDQDFATRIADLDQPRRSNNVPFPGDYGFDHRPITLLTTDTFPTTSNDHQRYPATGIAGQGCTESGLCFHGSSCIRGICICSAGHIPVNGICQMDGGHCRNGVCRCSPERRSASGLCLSTQQQGSPGEPCGSREQACSNGAYCSSASGVCECPMGMSSVDGVCQFTQSQRGQACATSYNCPKSAFCDNGYCLCKGTHEMVNGFCMPRPSPIGREHILPEFSHANIAGVTTMGARPDTRINNVYGTRENYHPGGGAIAENDYDFASRSPFESNFDRFYPQNAYNGINGGTEANSFGRYGINQPGAGLNGFNAFNNGYGSQMGAGLNGFNNLNSGYGAQQGTGLSGFNGMGMNTGYGGIRQPMLPPNFGSGNGFGQSVENFDGYQPRTRGTNNPRVFIIRPNDNFGMSGKPLRPFSSLSGGIPGGGLPNGPMPTHAFVPVPICTTVPCPAAAFGTQTFPYSAAQHRSMAPPVNRTRPHSDFKTAMPNGFCGEGQLCLGNSWCVEQFCRCAAGMILENGVCMNADSAPLAMDQQLMSNTRNHPPRSSPPLYSCANGEKCSGDSLCQLLEGVGAICGCHSQRHPHNNECVAVLEGTVVAPGEECANEGYFCSGGSVCDSGKCTCPQGRNETLGYCLLTSLPGESCGDGQVCLQNSSCDVELKLCSMITAVPPVELPKPWASAPGELCDVDNPCVENAFCSPTGFCTCEPGLVPYSDNCVHTRHVKQPGERCDAFDICIDSLCSDGACVCSNHELAVNGSCPGIKPSFPIQSCGSDADCVPTKQCVLGTCVCDAQSVESGDDCLPIYLSLLSNECNNSAQCPRGAHCSNGQCACIPPLLFNQGRCTGAKRLGEQCEPEDACLGGSFCIDGSCVCPDGARTRGSLCIDEAVDIGAKPGASCAERACGGGARCFNRYCVCGFAMNPMDDRCVDPEDNVHPGGFCSYSYQCMPGLVCMNKICMCINESVLDAENCVKEKMAAPPGGSCAESQECNGGSTCREGWCVCPDPMMIVSRGICVQSQPRPTIPPRLQTTTPASTYVPPTVPSYLTVPPSSVYTYRPTSLRSTANTNLPTTISSRRGLTAYPTQSQNSFEPRKAAAGTSCGPLDICVGGSMCVDSVCICPAGSTISNGACLTVHSWSQPEEKSAAGDLDPFDYWPLVSPPTTSHVIDTVSLTLGPTTPSRQRFITTEPDLQSITGPMDECAAVGLLCRGGTVCRRLSCQCPDGHVLLNDQCLSGGRTSLRKGKSWAQGELVFARPNEPCTHGESCTGGSICSEKKICLCPPDQPVVREHTCIASDEKPMLKMRIAGPGESCNSETRCTAQSICYQGYCRCQAGYVSLNGQCVRLPTTTPSEPIIVGLDQSCGDDRRCAAGAVCDDETMLCSCPEETLPYNGACIATVTTKQPTTPTRTFVSHSRSSSRLPTTSSSRFTSPVRVVSQAQQQQQSSISTRPGQCSDDTQCEQNRICIVGKCKCRSGYAEMDGLCEQVTVIQKPVVVDYGNACSVRDQCARRSECLNGICNCPSGTIMDGDGLCTSMGDLAKGIIETFGQIKKSTVLSALSSTNLTKFLPNIELALPKAKSDGKTKKNFSFSASDFSNFLFNNISTPSTVRHVELAQPCTIGVDHCPVNAHCIGLCTCKPGFSVYRNNCISAKILFRKQQKRQIIPGNHCLIGDECLNGSICIDTVCRCPTKSSYVEGYCISNSILRQFAPAGSSCANGELCSGGSVCDYVDKICICASGHRAHFGKCQNKDTIDLPKDESNNHRYRDVNERYRPRKDEKERQLAEECPLSESPVNCQLPNCFCSKTGRSIPGDLSQNETPQFIILTFDDAVNGKTLPYYRTLFEHENYRNPNDCAIKATFFVSHEWTNYDGVEWLNSLGHEIASNSITHETLQNRSAERWADEMDGQRQILANYGNVEEENIIGLRAPQLALGANEQFEMMSRTGFIYDNSAPTSLGDDGLPFWPQTLDYRIAWECLEKNCPNRKFPGVWMVPLNHFTGTDNKQSAMIRAALDGDIIGEEVTDLLWDNFNRSYHTNRAPFVVTLNWDFLQLNDGAGMNGLMSFLDQVLLMDEVYVVSIKQLLAWMRNPLPRQHLHQVYIALIDHNQLQIKELQCIPPDVDQEDQQKPNRITISCTVPNRCMYRTPMMNSAEHQFQTCNQCPDVFPWLGNANGDAIEVNIP